MYYKWICEDRGIDVHNAENVCFLHIVWLDRCEGDFCWDYELLDQFVIETGEVEFHLDSLDL